MAIRYALDTNVLLRLYDKRHQQNKLITDALRRLAGREAEFCFTAQNLGEFWNVSTRPVELNGFGLSIQNVYARSKSIERRMTFLPENKTTYDTWLHLLLTHEVRGAQVHDAHLAATLEAHGVNHLLTFNGKDFKRYKNINPVHPEDVQP